MYRTILVPLDGSGFAEQALPLARGLAGLSGANLRLAHVQAPHPPVPVVADGLMVEAELRSQREQHEREYLDAVCDRLARDVPTAATLLQGPIAATLSRHAAEIRADLVVMTSHGATGLERWWLGSVAEGLIRSCETALLLLRPAVGEQAPEPAALQRVLIALDGSPLAEQILGPALALGGLLKADYTLLRVVEPFVWGGRPIGVGAPLDAERITRECELDARGYLERVATRLRQDGHGVESRVVRAGRPAAAILESALALPGALIALATHGRGGLARLLVGSVADKVIRGGHTPVLVLRPRPAQDP